MKLSICPVFHGLVSQFLADVIGWNPNGIFYALSGKDCSGKLWCGYSALDLELHAYDRSVNAIGFFYISDQFWWNFNGTFYVIFGKDTSGQLKCGYAAMAVDMYAIDTGRWSIGVIYLPVKKEK